MVCSTVASLSFRAKSRNPVALPDDSATRSFDSAGLRSGWPLCRFDFLKPARGSLIPERVKVEPVVRSQTRIILQPREVALHPRLGLLGAMLPIQHDLVSEMFEINV